jgi:hypothetical protein
MQEFCYIRAIDRMPVSGSALLARRSVLALSAALGFVGLYWIAHSFRVDGKLRFGNPIPNVAAEGLFGPVPLSVRAEVTRSNNAGVARQGDSCAFLVEQRRRDAQSYYCNAQVMCGGKLVYGGPDRGYFSCRFYQAEGGQHGDVIGNDPTTTHEDRDSGLYLDTRAGVVRVWDDASGVHGAFELEAEVLSVQ